MPVTNIIYACDDLCDLCEYLRLLEKRKKFFVESRIHCSRRRGRPTTMRLHFFAESKSHNSRRRAALQREPNISLSAKGSSSTRAKYFALGEGPPYISLSAKEWPPVLTAGRALTVNRLHREPRPPLGAYPPRGSR
jgi:hypothetical protein